MNDIGKMIKNVRNSKKVTLKDLSKETELSVSFLSQVERGLSSLTVTSLTKIVNALGVSLKDFFDNEEDRFMDTNDRRLEEFLKKNYESHRFVSGKFEGRKLEGIIYTIKHGAYTESTKHEGEEIYYVISGRGSFFVDGKEYELKEGSTIHIPSRLEHSIKVPEGEEMKVFVVLTPTLI